MMSGGLSVINHARVGIAVFAADDGICAGGRSFCADSGAIITSGWFSVLCRLNGMGRIAAGGCADTGARIGECL